MYICSFFVFILLFCILNSNSALCELAEDLSLDMNSQDNFIPESEEPEVSKKKDVVKPKYEPVTTDLEFADSFDGDVFSRWIISKNNKFSGIWKATVRQIEAIEHDLGLRMMNRSTHHAISTSLPKDLLVLNSGKASVVSYEVKFEDGTECGGAYLKLFHKANLDNEALELFDNETPYVVMFGPDVCGTTNKVHLIIKTINPISKKSIEHHLKEPPAVPVDQLTHVYTFALFPNNTYAVLIDNEIQKQGSMLTDFEPTFTPPKIIEDLNDTKPSTWVDEPKIPDPTKQKPEDWDEEAPITIPDPSAVKPDDWLEDEEAMIPDVHAEQPSDWDVEKQGEWEPPLVPNPQCAQVSGCGTWTPPLISNPNYKGKWKPPLIDNPDYKGPWQPRKIPNPDYYTNDYPHGLDDITALGFELWTVQAGTLFDNVVVSRDLKKVKQFIDSTWKKRFEIEQLLKDNEEKSSSNTKKTPSLHDQLLPDNRKFSSYLELALSYARRYPLQCAVGGFGVLLLLIVALKSLKKSVSVKEEGLSTREKEQNKKPTSKPKKADEETSSSEEATEELKGKEDVATSTTTRKRGAPSKQE